MVKKGIHQYLLSPSRSFIYRIAVIGGIAAPILLVITDAIGAFVSPAYNPLIKSISNLGLGPAAWLQSLSFILFGITVMALASDVYSELHKAKDSKVGIILLMFIGFSFIALGVFRTDAVVDPETFHGVIHHITAWIVGGLFPISCLVFAHIFKADSRWRSMYVYTIMAGTLGILLIAVWVIYQKNWFGLSERLLIWNGLVWFEVVAIHLEHISKHLP